MYNINGVVSLLLQTLYLVAVWIGYFGLLTSFSPSYTWVLILRGLVGGGMAGSPQS